MIQRLWPLTSKPDELLRRELELLEAQRSKSNKEAPNTIKPLKVLFFSHDGKLGDAIVNTAFVAAVFKNNPACEIHVTVAGVTAAFWSQDRRIKKLWRFQKPGWGDVIRTGMALRQEQFDFIVPWRRMRSEKNRLLMTLASPRRIIDLHEYHQGEVRHQICSCAEALVQMNQGGNADLAYDLGKPARPSQLDRILPPSAEIIVLNLFAADVGRTIPISVGSDMLDGLRRSAPNAILCLLCTDATQQAAHATLVGSGIEGKVINCDGDLNSLFDLCERAAVVISPDSALIHIASAFDTPVVGIYQNNGIKAIQWAPRSRLQGTVLSACPNSIAGFSIGRVLSLVCDLRARGALAA